MELSGSLRRFSVSNVFQLLNMERATGNLTLRRGRARIVVTLKAGDVLDVGHSGTPIIKRLSDLLLEGGRMSEGEWVVIQDEQRSRLVPLGQLLHDRIGITEAEFLRLVKLVFYDILFECLRWKDGTYDFKRLDKVESDHLSEPLSMQTILLNAAQEEDEWPHIRRYVPSNKSAFAPSETDIAGWESAQKKMPPEDQKITELIDGTRTVRRISAILIRSEFEVSRLIMELSRRGLLERVSVPLGEEALARPKFLSLRIGPAAVFPLVLAFIVVFLLHAWKYYLGPLAADPQQILTPLLHGGRDPITIDKLRLQRLRDAFQLFQLDRGIAPPSLETLVEQGYCSPEDLCTASGTPFVFKILGTKEERAVIQAVDARGEIRPDMTAEINVQ